MISWKKGIVLAIVLSGIIISETTAQHYSHYSKHTAYRRNTQKGLLANDKLTITAGLGAAAYFGDICDGIDCAKPRMSAGIGGMLRVTDRIGAMVQFNYFRLYAEDVYTLRNFRFRSDNAEMFAAAFVNMFKYERYEFRSRIFNPYLFVGIGTCYYAPQGYYKGGWYDLRSVQTEGVPYSTFSAMIPFGFGVNFHVGPKLDIQLEAAYRKTFTDHLDDVSSDKWLSSDAFATELEKNLANPSGMGDEYWKNNPVAYRGNPNKDDWYVITQVKLKYSLSKKRHKISRNGLHKNHRRY
jgi:hypothetical protein